MKMIKQGEGSIMERTKTIKFKNIFCNESKLHFFFLQNQQKMTKV